MKTRKNKQLAARAGKNSKTLGACGRKLRKPKSQIRQAWVRDGYTTYMHYLADTRRQSMICALLNEDHEFHGIAKAAHAEGLLQ